ncbi:SDR family oxidoreductase [Meiothermus hypogaeus]|uniref:dTDP-4-dehydrorhamnose reductase n=2 Tax=Meiothermus hypogaeus TaxID=884155 RepID=A0A511R2A0_9DEIN|nr:NAD(P)-dependent oxidoreductase [Meiothermus hypogaeus]RIH75822.1 dTDP-4-dehydrorhamnose reductase [Meiothermus hypogaeus]GEM83735.1 dTDP-4-rhamnose reductase [Meiothermus hypogaeus NBRC 106114]
MSGAEHPEPETGPILLTGGTGRLGSALRGLIPNLIAPGREELDITDLFSVQQTLERYQPQVVVHAAAYTDVAQAETEKVLCWRVNVEGTRNLVRAVLKCNLHFVHISTDYVFWGDKGGYKEDDPVGPVRNYYALSKLAAEEVVRVLPRYLIIRTSFRPSPFPYPVAYHDLYTSQDYIEVIAPQIALALQNLTRIPYHTLHIATERKSVYELAKRTRPDVRPASKQEAGVSLPEDISLDVRRWKLQIALLGSLSK